MAAVSRLTSVLRSEITLYKSAKFTATECLCWCTRARNPKTPWIPFSQTVRNFHKQIGRNPRTKLSPVENVEAPVKGGFRVLLRPFAYTVLVSGCSYSGAIIWQYESLRTYYQQARDSVQAQQEIFYGKAGSFRHHMNSWWNSLSPGKQIVAQIIGMNTAVFLLWKIRPLQSIMLKCFASSPFSGARSLSMTLSTFSHYNLLHLGVNMFVLWSFSGPATNLLGREQFVAFYLTAGVVSSFSSYIYKVARLSLVPSLGASGVIMAMLGMVCCQHPDAQLSIAFVDWVIPHSFSADTGMKALIAMDTLGIIFGWRLFDHAAHLGGMLFGIWYDKYGRDLIWRRYREPIMKLWHDLRGKP